MIRAGACLVSGDMKKEGSRESISYHEALESTKGLSPALINLNKYHVTSSETRHSEEWGSAAGLYSSQQCPCVFLLFQSNSSSDYYIIS